MRELRWPIGMAVAMFAMTVVVVASNYLVQYPVNDWVTYGAFTYPIAFLVTDLTNRVFGANKARWVVFIGFALAVVLSSYFATPRIAVASGCSFLLAQLCDVFLFDKLRRAAWWRAPLISSSIASLMDTVLFFTLAFIGTGLPWITWAVGDYTVKLFVAVIMLIPFRLLMPATRPVSLSTGIK